MRARPLVLCLCLLFLAACSGSSPTSPSDSGSGSLTPARSLVGFWSTAAPVTFYYQSDFCGSRQTVAQALWHVGWTVTAVSGFSNVIHVEMAFNRGGASPLGNCQPNGWVPLPSPIEFNLCISSSRISGCSDETYTDGYGFGSFTSDLMQLTWTHWDCVIYCFGEFTQENELKLVKQR